MKIKIKTIDADSACKALLSFSEIYSNDVNINAIDALKYLLAIPYTEIDDGIIDILKNNVEKNIITKEYFFKNDICKYNNEEINQKFIGNFKTKSSIIDYIKNKILVFLLFKKFNNGSNNFNS